MNDVFNVKQTQDRVTVRMADHDQDACEGDAGSRMSLKTRLGRSEQRFHLLVDSVIDYAIFMLDPNGVVMSWNRGARRIKGYSADEIIGKHFSVFYTPEDLARDHPAEELEVAKREGRFEEEGWRVRKDGTRFWANVVITALRDEDGTLTGFAKVTRDMTERREGEERLKEMNRQLESFAYAVSHDLRAPLRNMAFTSGLLLADHVRDLDHEGTNWSKRSGQTPRSFRK